MPSLFQKPKIQKPPDIPELPPVTPLADPEDEVLRARQAQVAARQTSRTGRQSTILSDRLG